MWHAVWFRNGIRKNVIISPEVERNKIKLNVTETMEQWAFKSSWHSRPDRSKVLMDPGPFVIPVVSKVMALQNVFWNLFQKDLTFPKLVRSQFELRKHQSPRTRGIRVFVLKYWSLLIIRNKKRCLNNVLESGTSKAPFKSKSKGQNGTYFKGSTDTFQVDAGLSTNECFGKGTVPLVVYHWVTE